MSSVQVAQLVFRLVRVAEYTLWRLLTNQDNHLGQAYVIIISYLVTPDRRLFVELGPTRSYKRDEWGGIPTDNPTQEIPFLAPPGLSWELNWGLTPLEPPTWQ